MQWAGIDLAWGSVNTTAAVMLEFKEGSLVVSSWADDLTDNSSICSWLAGQDRQEGLVIGIDAPLVVSNFVGERPCETTLRRCFGRYEAGPLPANRTLFKNDVRGERLVQHLARYGITRGGSYLPRQQNVRTCYEVFPHTAHVALFHLVKTLKYKAGTGRTRETRLLAYEQLIEYIANVNLGGSPLMPPSWLRVPHELRGARLKRFEDTVDALVCAFTAAYLWWWGNGERCRIVGDANGEHIVVPITPELARCLDRVV